MKTKNRFGRNDIGKRYTFRAFGAWGDFLATLTGVRKGIATISYHVYGLGEVRAYLARQDWDRLTLWEDTGA
jgi:hypothetical protein